MFFVKKHGTQLLLISHVYDTLTWLRTLKMAIDMIGNGVVVDGRSTQNQSQIAQDKPRITITTLSLLLCCTFSLQYKKN